MNRSAPYLKAHAGLQPLDRQLPVQHAPVGGGRGHLHRREWRRRAGDLNRGSRSDNRDGEVLHRLIAGAAGPAGGTRPDRQAGQVSHERHPRSLRPRGCAGPQGAVGERPERANDAHVSALARFRETGRDDAVAARGAIRPGDQNSGRDGALGRPGSSAGSSTGRVPSNHGSRFQSGTGACPLASGTNTDRSTNR